MAGLIVVVLDNRGAERLADAYDRIVVLFNARKTEAALVAESLRGAPLALHEVQAASADPVVRLSRFETASGRFTVPARTTAVFVERKGSQP